MKYAHFKLEDNTVEVYNSILGVESVILNGRKVSKGFSFFGRDHFFELGQDKYRITPQISFTHFVGRAIRVYKNGEPISPANKISKNDKYLLIGRFISGILLGAFIGWNIGPTSNSIIEFVLNLWAH